MRRGDRPWTDDEHATLVRLAAQGWSAGQIATKLHRERNAIVGRAWRSGIQLFSNRPEMIARIKARTEPPVIQIGRPRQRPTATTVKRAILNRALRAPDKPIPVLRVVDSPDPRPWSQGHYRRDCAWPVSGEGADMMACCAPTHGDVYCKSHKAIATKSTESPAELVRSLRRYVG